MHHKVWCMVSEMWSTTDRIFCNFGLFFPFYSFSPPWPPLTLKAQEIKIKKKWKKKCLEISSRYTSVPRIMIRCYAVLEIWHVMDKIFIFHFGLFLPFYPSNSPKNQHLEKNEQKTWRYHQFTQVYQKLWSDDIQFLRYGLRWTDRWTDGQTDGQTVGHKKWHIEVDAHLIIYLLR